MSLWSGIKMRLKYYLDDGANRTIPEEIKGMVKKYEDNYKYRLTQSEVDVMAKWTKALTNKLDSILEDDKTNNLKLENSTEDLNINEKVNRLNNNEGIKNSVKVTVLEVENQLVQDFFKKGEVMSLLDANERFKKIERSPQYMLEASEKFNLNHPYTKVGFKIELTSGKSTNVRYSFGSGECKDLIDYIEGYSNIPESDKLFFKDFKNDFILNKIAKNFGIYVNNAKSEYVDDIYNDFLNLDKDISFEESIFKSPIEAVKLIKEYIPKALDRISSVEVGSVDDMAKTYFKENTIMNLLDANKMVKQANREIAHVINGFEDMEYPIVNFKVEVNKEITNFRYSLGYKQDESLIDMPEIYEKAKLLADTFEYCEQLDMDYLKNEYRLSEISYDYVGNIVSGKDDNLMYIAAVDEFGYLEAFKLSDNTNLISSYLLEKGITGLSKNYVIDFNNRYTLNHKEINSKVAAVSTDQKKLISTFQRVFENRGLIKDVSSIPELSNINKLNKGMDFSISK